MEGRDCLQNNENNTELYIRIPGTMENTSANRTTALHSTKYGNLLFGSHFSVWPIPLVPLAVAIQAHQSDCLVPSGKFTLKLLHSSIIKIIRTNAVVRGKNRKPKKRDHALIYRGPSRRKGDCLPLALVDAVGSVCSSMRSDPSSTSPGLCVSAHQFVID